MDNTFNNTFENILDLPITSAELNDCIDEIVRIIDAPVMGSYFVCANPHSLVVAETDPIFKQAIQAAD